MLFMITQTHSPETCPIDSGGAETLIDKTAQGIKVKGRWGAWSNHKIWYLVDAEDPQAIQRFLDPGMKLSTSSVEPVGDAPLQR